jgi:hypothetical protein
MYYLPRKRIMKPNLKSMKRGEKISKFVIALLFLLMLSFYSCEVFYCEECSNGEESFWECSQNAIDQWENMGYTCE